MIKKLFVVTFFMFLFGCATRETPPAPVVDGIAQFADTPAPAVATSATPTTNSDTSSTTKVTKLTPMSSNNNNTPVDDSNANVVIKKHAHKVVASSVAADDDDDSANNTIKTTSKTRYGWMMPAAGEVVGKYSAAKKGIEIKGVIGSSVVAASNGKVVYSGNGLKGYGNLIILKHDNGYLTAYALNKVNLVKVGQSVKCGDKIAEIGKGGVLHFELRKDGKPVNPNNYINGN